MALIDNANAWDAIQIINIALDDLFRQVFAADGVDVDTTIVNVDAVIAFYDRPEVCLLNRIFDRIMQSYEEGNI